jgi:diguanylate cyclase (GGDEF)-like protein
MDEQVNKQGDFWQRLISWMGGNDLSDINRIFNIACFIGSIFSFLAGVESALASLSLILIANNFFYSLVLASLFYLARFKHYYGASRFISVFVLLFVYTPILWIYNGGSSSGIPYYLVLFASFLTILVIGNEKSEKTKTLNGIILLLYSAIITGLIVVEMFFPQIFYKFENPGVRYFDMTISMLFALASNYFILRAFIELYYKQLDQIKEYSLKLEELVVRDSMTNLYNHGFAVNRLTEEVERAARYKGPLSIMMADIDHFKSINDRFGHPFGDEVLIKLAGCFQHSCRNVDIVARYGGEEFLIILPGTSAAMAEHFAQRLSANIHEMQYNNPVEVTISGGITEYHAGDSCASMIDRADALLYEAKKDGRDMILC